MNTQRHLNLRRLAAASTLTFVAAPAVLAQPGTADPATETALLVTGILTIIIVALTLLALIMPREDIDSAAKAFARLKRSFISVGADRGPLSDHDFDGIRELDNKIPPWFTILFLGTVVFGTGYLLNYHVFHSAKLPAAEYQDEVSAADLQRRIRMASEGTIDENTLVQLKDPESLKRGGEEFKKYCVSCHGMFGQGVIGPNLTDQYWIHGGGIKNVYQTIKNGVPAKGMISWQLVFSPKQIQEIGSYVLSLQGSNPPGAKKPEGNLYVAQDSAATVAGAPSATSRKESRRP